MKSSEFKQLLADQIMDNPGFIREVKNIDNKDYCDRALASGVCLDDRYRVVGCIGIGGFGITYLCEDLWIHRNVAIKEYFPNEWSERDEEYVVVKKSKMMNAFHYGMKSFLKEIHITAKFIHTPNLITIYDAFESNDTLYMVMEFISGISLGREMKGRGYKPYTEREMADVVLPVLQGVDALHNKSIVHSDISPGNIIRAKDGTIVLIDMGAAKYMLDYQPPLSATFLKIDYAAPEQYQTAKEGIPRGEGAWTDVYAVGATMYYMLTGHKPIDVITRLSSLDSRLILPNEYEVKLSEKMIYVLERAMELEKTKRFRSATDLSEAIKDAIDDHHCSN